jgi:peptidase E
MTKYILNSGGLKNKLEKSQKFFEEILKDSGQNPKILMCFFAQPREDWENKFEEYKNGLLEFSKEPNPIFELATPDKFAEQVKDADIIYLHGGDDHLLQYWLKQYNLPEMWEGKVVVGSSAGSDALVKSFWTCDWRQCMDGMGLIPIKFIPHYKSTEYGKNDPRGSIDWSKAYDEIKEYGDSSLPIYALEEGDYKVFEV